MAGVTVSLLLIVGATIGIIVVVCLWRRYEQLSVCVDATVYVLCVYRKRSSFKDLFPTGHFKVLSKRQTMPDSKDMSLDQISSEPTVWTCC